jgi:hypothetical protein
MEVKSIIVIFILFVTHQSFANTFAVGLGGSLSSKKLNGTLDAVGSEGKLISNSNLHLGLNFAYSLTNSFRLLFAYESRQVDFDNTEVIIAGEESFKVDSTKLGVRWITHPRVALRFLITSEKDLAFNINETTNMAEIYSENLTYFSVYYDQVVFLASTMYSGFRLGYDVSSSGSTIEGRSANIFEIFGIIGALEVNYQIKNITKSNSDLTFAETDSALNALYTLRF